MTPCNDCNKCDDMKRVEWYKDKKIGIFFTPEPCVTYRVILPSMRTAEKNSITKYPFENKRTLRVELFDYKKDKKYEFSIPKGYCWDGASIPRLF